LGAAIRWIGLALTCCLLASACASISPEPSRDAFCGALAEGEQRLRQTAEDATRAGNPLEGFLLALGGFGEVNQLMDDLANTAPSEIATEMAIVRDTVAEQTELADGASGGVAAQLISDLLLGFTNRPQFERVDQFALDNCGTQVFGLVRPAPVATPTPPTVVAAKDPEEVGTDTTEGANQDAQPTVPEKPLEGEYPNYQGLAGKSRSEVNFNQVGFRGGLYGSINYCDGQPRAGYYVSGDTAIVRCGTSGIAVDLVTLDLLWARLDLPEVVSTQVSGDLFVYELVVVSTPAEGLTPSSSESSVIVRDPATGDEISSVSADQIPGVEQFNNLVATTSGMLAGVIGEPGYVLLDSNGSASYVSGRVMPISLWMGRYGISEPNVVDIESDSVVGELAAGSGRFKMEAERCELWVLASRQGSKQTFFDPTADSFLELQFDGDTRRIEAGFLRFSNGVSLLDGNMGEVWTLGRDIVDLVWWGAGRLVVRNLSGVWIEVDPETGADLGEWGGPVSQGDPELGSRPPYPIANLGRTHWWETFPANASQLFRRIEAGAC